MKTKIISNDYDNYLVLNGHLDGGNSLKIATKGKFFVQKGPYTMSRTVFRKPPFESNDSTGDGQVFLLHGLFNLWTGLQPLGSRARNSAAGANNMAYIF